MMMGFDIRPDDSITQLSTFSFRIRKFHGNIVERSCAESTVVPDYSQCFMFSLTVVKWVVQ